MIQKDAFEVCDKVIIEGVLREEVWDIVACIGLGEDESDDE